MKYITTCCNFVFYGLNHSPEHEGVCRNCRGLYGHWLRQLSKYQDKDTVTVEEVREKLAELEKDALE